MKFIGTKCGLVSFPLEQLFAPTNKLKNDLSLQKCLTGVELFPGVNLQQIIMDKQGQKLTLSYQSLI